MIISRTKCVNSTKRCPKCGSFARNGQCENKGCENHWFSATNKGFKPEWASVERRLSLLESTLDYLAEMYSGDELYEVLVGCGMTEEEIEAAGFESILLSQKKLRKI